MKREYLLFVLALIFVLALAACSQTTVTPEPERVIETVIVTQVVESTEVVVVVPTEEPEEQTATPEPAPEEEAADVTPTPTLAPGYAGLLVITAAGDELGTVETTIEGPAGTNYVVVNTGENVVPVPEPLLALDQENSMLMYFLEESLLAEAPSFASIDEIDQAALDEGGEVSTFWGPYIGAGS